MQKYPLWKPIVMVAVVLLTALAVYFIPLRLGLDLAGGTRLVYQVWIPPEEAARADRIVDDVIEVQRNRVDPQGVMNLVWRKQAGNRIEIQMPLANEETEAKRQAWQDAREKIIEGNLDQSLVSSSTLDSPNREATFDRVAGDNKALRQKLAELANAYDAYKATAEPYQEAKKEVEQRREALKELTPAYNDVKAAYDKVVAETADAINDYERARSTFEKARKQLEELKKQEEPAKDVVEQTEKAMEEARQLMAERQEAYDAAKRKREAAEQVFEEKAKPYKIAKAALDQAEESLLAKTKRRVAAEEEVDKAQRAVLSYNIAAGQIYQITALSDKAKEGELSARDRAIKNLKESHPARVAQIEEAVNAWQEYEKVRGALDDPQDLIRLLRGAGELEFRIVPSPQAVGDVDSYAKRLHEKGPMAGRDLDYVWREIDELVQFVGKREDTSAEQKRKAQELATIKPDETQEQYEQRVRQHFAERGLIGMPFGGKIYMLVANQPGQRITGAEEGWEVVSASRTADQLGFPAAAFRLNAAGGRYMLEMTSKHVGEPMAIILDGRVMSAPNINDALSTNIIVTKGGGGYTEKELSYIVRTLAAGSLAGRMGDEPISITKIAPSAGKDNLEHGLTAAYAAVIVVAIFMLIYYFFAGFVADLALAANIIIILALMAIQNATFTLPGIAGIVLTMGMAVDANVLIFERIREEMERKADLRTAVRLGYEKALSTILDANITTLITCVVLYYTATAEVKGFALTLMIGIAASMFTALFCTRIIIDYYIRFTHAKKIMMLPTTVDAVAKLLKPNFDWIGKRKLFFMGSGVIVILSLIFITLRGADILDIEFRSGTQVSFSLKEGARLDIDQAREILDGYADEKKIEDLDTTKASIVGVGDAEGTQYSQFAVQTLIQDRREVGEHIKAAFGEYLGQKDKLTFNAADVEDHNRAPVYPLKDSLGEAIGRPGEVAPVESRFLGGVAIVLEDLRPATTTEDIEDRIARMRQQPPFNTFNYRDFKVIGLDKAEGSTAAPGEARYKSVAVVVRDENTDYRRVTVAEFERQDDQALAAGEWELVRTALQRDTTLDSVTSFSSQVSSSMRWKAIRAMFLSLLAVVIYIWVRFGQLRYGLAAIAALVHDVIIALGMIALSGLVYNSVGSIFGIEPFRIDLAMVAAMLTIVGYSLNDTIVVFDRIRENRGKLAVATPGIINESINQTISRTLLTSVTTLLALITLYAFGGAGSLHGFAYAMIVGVFIGTYSSIGIASSVLTIGAQRDVKSEQAGGVPATA